MMQMNKVITLDQLEGSEYVFKIISTILPSLCLDYKVDPMFFTTYIHPFDAVYNPDIASVTDDDHMRKHIYKVGINYILQSLSTLPFPAVIRDRSIDMYVDRPQTSEYNNPISVDHSFSDLPLFTRELMKLRTRSFEAYARFFGGYVKSTSSPDIKSPVAFININFENSYLASLLHRPFAGDSFRARYVDGVMLAKDLENLLGVRTLLDARSRDRFDAEFAINEAARAHNITIAQNPVVDTELTTMPLKPLVVYFNHFNWNYDLRPLTFNGDRVIANQNNLASFVASVNYQSQLQRLVGLGFELRDELIIRVIAANGAIEQRQIAADGIKFIRIRNNISGIFSLLSVLARSDRVPDIMFDTPSLFWDGISYDDYKNKKITDLLFYTACCYVMALYEKNNITYCSMLSDVLNAGEQPIRVCFLPRVIGGKTAAKLVSEILSSVNSASVRDFPKHSTIQHDHVGLSEQGFVRFFQMLRLVDAKTPEQAIKEVFMAYAGVKLTDTGSPHKIKESSYKDFILLLFGAMGFRVTIHRAVVSSHNYTTYSISPPISRHYITTALTKASCSKEEAEKLMSTAHELLAFMISAGNLRNTHSYRYARRWGGSGTCRAGSKDSGETLVQFASPMCILDRINVKDLLSATTLNEMLAIDAFLPENTSFKNNIDRLIETDQLSGDSIMHVMPLNLIDRLVSVAGTPVSISTLMDNIGDPSDDCDTTNEIVDMINNALRESYAKEAAALTSHTINSVAARSERQLQDVRQSACQVAAVFKNLARSIYATERIFKIRISDDVKADILEKYKAFVELSKSLYYDLISLEHIKALLYIIKRSGRSIEETEIGPEELRKSYELIRPKVGKLATYYTDISRSYFEQMKKNLNMVDSSSVTFDVE